MMAEWILEGRPSLDLWPLDVRRFSFHHTTTPLHRARGWSSSTATTTSSPRPGSEHATARGVRRSPLHDRLAARRGRVRLAWRVGAAELVRAARRRRRSTSRRSPAANWFEHVGREAPRRSQRRRPDRPDQLRQVRDRRARRARRRAVAVGRRHGQVGRHGHLHPAVQRAGRHRVRPDDDAHRARHLVRRHRRRRSAPTTWAGSGRTARPTAACWSAT